MTFSSVQQDNWLHASAYCWSQIHTVLEVTRQDPSKLLGEQATSHASLLSYGLAKIQRNELLSRPSTCLSELLPKVVQAGTYMTDLFKHVDELNGVKQTNSR